MKILKNTGAPEPHIGTDTMDTRIAMPQKAPDNILNFLKSIPTKIVNEA